MNEELEKLLLKRLNAELSPAERQSLDRLLESDPAAARLARATERRWGSIPEPPNAGPTDDFAETVVHRALSLERSAFPPLSLAPSGARWASAAAALGGLALGVFLAAPGRPEPPVSSTRGLPEPTNPVAGPASATESAAPIDWTAPTSGAVTLADTYWTLVLGGEESRSRGGAG